ncbi:MAG: Asp-tRNA(Asn)/Glu-tRNA(Gln) amidotransferase subunit GatC [Pseudomonadota bacterium]
MSITKEDVQKLGRLARIYIPEDEVQKRTDNINGILQWIEQLQEVNTDGVEPLRDIVGTELSLRKDEVNDGGYPEKVLKNAPEETQNFFVVPKVVE